MMEWTDGPMICTLYDGSMMLGQVTSTCGGGYNAFDYSKVKVIILGHRATLEEAKALLESQFPDRRDFRPIRASRIRTAVPVHEGDKP